MSFRGMMQDDQLTENVYNLSEASRLLDKEKEERNKLITEIDKTFKLVFQLLHLSGHSIEKRQLIAQQLDVTIFRQTSQLIAGTPIMEFKILKSIQNMFFKVFISHHYNPPLLYKILAAYYKQLIVCFHFVERQHKDISMMLQFASIATQTEAIKKLQALFSRRIWELAEEYSDQALKREKIESKTGQDNTAI